MDSILSNRSETKLQGVLAPKSKEAVETAGSLAMNIFGSLFDNNFYDEFSTNNPFAVDYTQYSDSTDTVAYSGFLESFSNAVSTLGGCECAQSSCSFDGGGCSSGFTSMC